ncbi:hypothetical protein GcM1_080003 [Golovinomyces cichoracearum]|uniref:Secreted effector protein n=1 Tax=Golovinomyces cichoracearum TaxID=62708 RepID=A0A420JC99_9PEZI|nr:hypothetical protein GcM1_080003 [Golovinomyces cichoracearum]
MRLTRYFHTLICCSVYMFACVKAARPTLQFVNATMPASCHPTYKYADRVRIGHYGGSMFSGIRFTKGEIDKAAIRACSNLNRTQGCSGFRFCRIRNILIRRPEVYRGKDFSSADNTEFYLSHILHWFMFGYDEYLAVIQWNAEKRRCGGVGVVKKTSRGYNKCLSIKP